MNLTLETCERAEYCDDELGKTFTFVSFYIIIQAVVDSDRKYYFQAENEQERNEWFRVIQLEISNPTPDN